MKALACLLCVIGSVALADAPITSPKPALRPVLAGEPLTALRPEHRPRNVSATRQSFDPRRGLWRPEPVTGTALERIGSAIAAAREDTAGGVDLPPDEFADAARDDLQQELLPVSAGQRPLARNPGEAAQRAIATSAILVSATRHAPRTAIAPSNRPAAIEAMARRIEQDRIAGSVCGDPTIQGEAIGPLPGRGECGIANAVRVRSVSGVTLSTPATLDCRTATALRRWVDTGARPAVGSQGGGIAGLRVVAHYACRTRNNAAGARLSEHSFGRAIDIAGIQLADGSEMTLLTDWNSSAYARALRRMHQAACGPFGTVLGPDSNQYHRDHFHFDTARYRSGSYCR